MQQAKFTTVVQIGIGGSDLGPRAMYLARELGKKITLLKWKQNSSATLIRMTQQQF